MLHQSQGPGIVNLNARVSATQLACFHLFNQGFLGAAFSILALVASKSFEAKVRFDDRPCLVCYAFFFSRTSARFGTTGTS